MPRRQPAIRTCDSYSRDLKQRVIYQAHTLKMSPTEISISLDIRLRVVQRVIKTYRDTGEVCVDRRYTGRPPLMTMAASEVCYHRLYHSSPFTLFTMVSGGRLAYDRVAGALTRLISG